MLGYYEPLEVDLFFFFYHKSNLLMGKFRKHQQCKPTGAALHLEPGMMMPHGLGTHEQKGLREGATRGKF